MRQSIQQWTKQNLWKTSFKKFEVIWSAGTDHITSEFLKAVFRKFYIIKYIVLYDLFWAVHCPLGRFEICHVTFVSYRLEILETDVFVSLQIIFFWGLK